MAKLIFRQAAIDDLAGIWDYTMSTWSEKQADKYYRMIKAACKEIEVNTGIGQNYHKIKEGLRGYHAGKHVIFYQEDTDGMIEVIRILHERMDLKSRLID